MYNILKLQPNALVAEIMTRIYDRRLTTPSGGNISMVDNDGGLWVTPSQIDKGALKAEDIVCVAKDGTTSGKHKPTMEYLFHQGIYEARENIKAVTHAHPAGLVTLSMMKEVPDFSLIPALTHAAGGVGFSGYSLPGSQGLCDVVKAAFDGHHHAILMENHGVITIGRDLLESFHYLENLERMAQIFINACQLGKRNPIAEVDYSSLLQDVIEGNSFLKKHLSSDEENTLRKSLLEYLKRSYLRDLSTSTMGCLSVRTSAESFLISPFEEDVRYMGPHDMVFVENGAVEADKKPAAYWMLHQAIYNAHPSINSIACMQPAAVTAFALGEAPFETRTIPESYMMLKNVPKTGLAMAYQNPEEVAAMISDSTPNILIENDCLLTTGSSLFQAYDRLEVAEFTANSLIQSKAVGKLRRINDKNIKEIEKNFF